MFEVKALKVLQRKHALPRNVAQKMPIPLLGAPGGGVWGVC